MKTTLIIFLLIFSGWTACVPSRNQVVVLNDNKLFVFDQNGKVRSLAQELPPIDFVDVCRTDASVFLLAECFDKSRGDYGMWMEDPQARNLICGNFTWNESRQFQATDTINGLIMAGYLSPSGRKILYTVSVHDADSVHFNFVDVYIYDRTLKRSKKSKTLTMIPTWRFAFQAFRTEQEFLYVSNGKLYQHEIESDKSKVVELPPNDSTLEAKYDDSEKLVRISVFGNIYKLSFGENGNLVESGTKIHGLKTYKHFVIYQVEDTIQIDAYNRVPFQRLVVHDSKNSTSISVFDYESYKRLVEDNFDKLNLFTFASSPLACDVADDKYVVFAVNGDNGGVCRYDIASKNLSWVTRYPFYRHVNNLLVSHY